MPILKKLILYKAERHRENFLVNRKSGYYSDKLSSSFFNPKKPYANYQRRYQKKFVQEMHLLVDNKSLENGYARKTLTKYSHIKKCTIQPLSCWKTLPNPTIYRRKGFRRTFKILKQIKDLKLYFSGQFDLVPQKPELQACKNLLLLTKLETLSLPLFSYCERSNNVPLFTRTLVRAAERKSWKNFKSLNIHLKPRSSHRNLGVYEEILKKLLELLKFWKRTCWDIYQHASFQFELPIIHKIDGELAYMLTEIAQIAPKITKIHDCDVKKFSMFSEMLSISSGLKELALTLGEKLQYEPYLGLLNSLPDIQKLTLDVSESQTANFSSCKPVLSQIKTLKNLTSLSLKFHSMPTSLHYLYYGEQNSGEEASPVALLISDLANLRSLELVFGVNPVNEKSRDSYYCGLWLKDIFKAIGEKPKLEKLTLSFATFDFGRGIGVIFKSLCHCLQKLTQLSALKLEIRIANQFENEDVLALGQTLSKLTNLQDLTLKITKKFYFKIKTMLALFDIFVNSFKLLSKLDLKMSSVRTTHESHQALSDVVNKMKCLNSISLDLTGEIDWDLDLRTLEAKIGKKMRGDISHTKVYQP